MNENWTDDLRQQMEQYESTQVPEGLWEGIEQRLDGSSRAVVVPMWRRWAAACVAVGIVGVAGVMYFMPSDDDKPLAEGGVEHRLPKPKVAGSDTQDDMKQPDNAAAFCRKAMPEHQYAVVNQVPMDEKTEPVVQEKQEERVVNQNDTETVPADVPASSVPPSPPSYPYETTVSFPQNDRRNASGGNVRVAIYTTQMQNDKSLGMNGYFALSEHGTPDNTPLMLSKGKRGNMDYLALTNDGKNPVTDAHHQQPVRIGFSVGYDLNKRWSVSAGASYTKLKSTLTAGTESSYYTNDQTISYVGVPVNLSYNLLNNRYLRLYAMAGGMAEYGVGGESIVETVVKNNHLATEKHDIDDIPLQFSATIGGGAELNVYRSLGVFAEVGAAYYFDNNSKYTTIYSTHPLNLNLQFGVRWTVNSTK